MERPPESGGGPAVPIGGGVPIDPLTGERFGYLPRKAARRKIIIRRTLGLPWLLGGIGTAVLIGIAGIAFLLSHPGRPPSRYVDEGALTAYPAGLVTPLRSGAGWVDRRGSLTIWLTRESFCADGGWGAGPVRWDEFGGVHGAGSGGGPAAANLRYADRQVARGRLYVDPARSAAVAAPPGAALPRCAGARAVSP